MQQKKKNTTIILELLRAAMILKAWRINKVFHQVCSNKGSFREKLLEKRKI